MEETTLGNLRRPAGAARPKRRVGRGRGSGRGKTSGRGHKGQKSRAGSKRRAYFEGGQMPLARRLPKRGFSNYRFKITYVVINVGDLEDRFAAGDTVDLDTCRAKRLVRRRKDGLKVLGDGELTHALNIVASKVSRTARTKIEAAGGSVKETARAR